MAEWVCAQDPLKADSRQRLTTHLLDAVGARIAGGATEEGAMLARLFSEAPLDRAALGAATIKLTEIDDIHMASCTAPSSIVVPTALAVAARMPRSEVFARALHVGYEVITRFGIAVAGPNILYRGIWPTLLAAPLGAAAVTACLLGLNARQTTDALGIALTLTSGSPGTPAEVSPRWLLLGLAARAGGTAALTGAEGDRTLLDTDWMVRTHGIHCEPAPLVAAVQEPGAIGDVSLKPYCAAKQCIAAIDAFRDLLENGISPDDIVRLRVSVPPAYAGMIGHRNAAAGRVGRITSAPYHLALAAYQPEALDDVARPNLASDPEIAAFMERVEVIGEDELDAHYPRRWPARVEVVTKSGRSACSLVLDARGDPARASDFPLREKFHRLCDPVIGGAAADELAEACLGATERDEALAALCARLNA